MKPRRPAERGAIVGIHEQSSPPAVPAMKVVCASFAVDLAKVALAACTTPLGLKWPLVGSRAVVGFRDAPPIPGYPEIGV